jgi:L,D-peptidoglycan transpeptidase YkuD (ErfK/YbiS/YcfS/YnhG family)
MGIPRKNAAQPIVRHESGSIAPLARRAVLCGGLWLAAGKGAAGAMPSRFVDLEYAANRLSWPGGAAAAACGRSGVRRDKREGDGASPAGSFPLIRAFYRADRLARPETGLPLAAMRPDAGWVDDPADPQYNRLVTLPYAAHHEEMWRQDGLYDLVVVIGYNTAPVVPGRGSAIFLHCAAADFVPTAGCITIARDALLALLPLLGPGSRITILP